MNTDTVAKTASEVVLPVFQNMAKDHPDHYIINKMQAAIACQMYSKTFEHVSANVAPGDGKTFILTGLAKVHQDHHKDNVLFVTIEETLFN